MSEDVPGVHRRFDPLQGEWVLNSPQRSDRPWQGQRETVEPAAPAWDPECYLCPGNLRAGGDRNPDYQALHVFDNDFPALLADTAAAASGSGLLRSAPVRGRCRVLCYSPRHDLSLARMSDGELGRIVTAWQRESVDLGADWRWVVCFENRGEAMGCSSPHPHGQIWALDVLPTIVRREDAEQQAHLTEHGRPLLLDLVDAELADGQRVVIEDAHWLVVVPYWARWPFETLVLPRMPRPGMAWLTDVEAAALGGVLGELFRAYDNLFRCAFPYSFGWHGLPGPASAVRTGWQLHGHCYPPLLRSANIRKFMVGFELLAEVQRDITPESAAARLRTARGPHWQQGTQ